MPALVPGQTLQGTNLRIVKRLGAGGMGEVWEVENLRIKKRYCIKTIHERVANDPDTLLRFEREAEVLASIKHPNVVEVHDLVTTSDGITFVLMEKLTGINLRACIRSRRHIEHQDLLQIVIEVLEALGHVHAHGVVHRDVKPENIFLAESAMETVTKLLDFGIVHVVQRGAGRSLTQGKFLGTLAYAAPEQLQGAPASPANDIYAVGLVLYELLAGHGPFHDAGDAKAVALARLEGPAPPISKFASVAPELSHLLAHVLERDPSKRPHSAGAFASQLYLLRQQLRDEPVASAHTTDIQLMTQVHALTEAAASAPPPVPLPDADTEQAPNARQNATIPMADRPNMREAPTRAPGSGYPLGTLPVGPPPQYVDEIEGPPAARGALEVRAPTPEQAPQRHVREPTPEQAPRRHDTLAMTSATAVTTPPWLRANARGLAFASILVIVGVGVAALVFTLARSMSRATGQAPSVTAPLAEAKEGAPTAPSPAETGVRIPAIATGAPAQSSSVALGSEPTAPREAAPPALATISSAEAPDAATAAEQDRAARPTPSAARTLASTGAAPSVRPAPPKPAPSSSAKLLPGGYIQTL